MAIHCTSIVLETLWSCHWTPSRIRSDGSSWLDVIGTTTSLAVATIYSVDLLHFLRDVPENLVPRPFCLLPTCLERVNVLKLQIVINMMSNDGMITEKGLQRIGMKQSWPNKPYFLQVGSIVLIAESSPQYQIMSKYILNVALGILKELYYESPEGSMRLILPCSLLYSDQS
jgi:hypothetical protein